MRGTRAAALLCAALCAADAAALAPTTSPVEKACLGLEARVRNFQAQQCRDAGLTAAATKSTEGRPLLFRDFVPATAARGATKRILLLGGIHGDELSSVAVVFQWLELLKSDRYQRYQWRVLPSANPDGLFAAPSQRTNAHGIDLNRNFPTPGWLSRAPAYWKSKARSDPRRFPGTQPGSEPETRWIVEQIREFRPDAIVSVHAPYGLLDFDGPHDPPKKLGYLRLQPLGVYPGSLGEYAGLMLKLPVITMELPQSNEAPSASQSGRIWADLLGWLDKNIAAAPK
ncbi:MAG: hypothetical protein NVS9B10_04030 [Nevskia sp.]